MWIMGTTSAKALPGEREREREREEKREREKDRPGD
jgi:hypothetical protein